MPDLRLIERHYFKVRAQRQSRQITRLAAKALLFLLHESRIQGDASNC